MRLIEGYGADTAGPGTVLLDGARLPLPALNGEVERRHSPTGYQWGYAGSGPAELARAILVALYPDDPLVRLPVCYQHFKADVIAKLPRAAFRLTSTEVDQWFAAWRRTHHDLVSLERRDRF